MLDAVATAVSASTPASPADRLRAAARRPGRSPAGRAAGQVLRDLSAAGRDPLRPHPRARRGLAGAHRPAGRTHRARVPARGRSGRPHLARRAAPVQLPAPPSPVPFTIVVAAAPILGSELVEDVIQPLLELLLPSGARFADFESWSAVRANHQDLLARLAAHDPVVVLSGDVHYGFTAQLTRTEGGHDDTRRPAHRVGRQEPGDQERRHQPVQRAHHAARARARPRDLRVRLAVERRQDEAALGSSGGRGAGVGRHRRRAAGPGRARGRLGADGDRRPRSRRPTGWRRPDGRTRSNPSTTRWPTSPPPRSTAPWPGWDPGKSLRMARGPPGRRPGAHRADVRRSPAARRRDVLVRRWSS